MTQNLRRGNQLLDPVDRVLECVTPLWQISSRKEVVPMPCLLGLLAFFAPRLVMVLLFLFSNFMGRAYSGILIPLLGFFFMPLTTLTYAAAINWTGSVSGVYFFVVLIAALADLGIVGGGVRQSRSRWG